jgi:PAS domain S-box-containing protein
LFNKRPIKIKLLIPALALTVVLLFLSVMVISYSYSQMQALEYLNDKVTLNKFIANTLHSLQKERGLSSGYLENKKNNFKQDLLLQRDESDLHLFKLLKVKCLSKKIDKILNRLKSVRKNVDLQEITSKNVINFYSDINAYLLENIVEISKYSHIKIITQNLLAYVNFLYLKEYCGIERAAGVAILSQKRVTRDALIDFTNTISIQNQNESMFLKYAHKKIKSFYEKEISSHIFTELKNIQQNIIYGDITKIDITPTHWYKTLTKKLDILDKIAQFIENDTSKHIEEELENIRTIFIFVLLLTILSLAIFILMLVAFLRLAKEEQKMRLITQKYIISSITDLNGKITDVSDAFCKISGYSKSELIGSSHNIVRHPDMSKETFEQLWKTIKRGETWRGKVKNLKKDTGFYWVYANIEPLFNTKGKIDSYLSVRLDITESELLTLKIKEEEDKNRITQEMMYQQSRLAQMGEMLSMIAHQWRQPLSAITAASGSISFKAKLKKLDQNTAIELSEKIKEFSQHLSDTIDDFRGFFKSNKAKSDTNFKIIVEDVLKIVKSSLENNGITLLVNVVSCDNFLTHKSELKQVLLNLIKNSEDALKENAIDNPIIIIEVEKKTLIIIDNAGGIAEENLEKIFDPYFSTKTKKDGTGLGLYMSKTIIEEHCNGSLSVSNSEFIDQKGNAVYGAKFKIILGKDND